MDDLTPLRQAIERGDEDAVRAMIAANPALLHARDEDGATALHCAAFFGRRGIAELLLNAGAEINARDTTYGATPAGWAIHYLRERGALLAIEIEDVLFAIRRGDADWAERLVTRHPWVVDAVDREGKPLATHAANSGDPKIARLFAQHSRST